ncbi:MAG TPA: cell division protein ZapE [Egibacteraceae bacterium]|nr:cell division protein ZapE [Egibacteraceae bacterium]
MPIRLVDRHPDPPAAKLIAGLVPPPRFDAVRFGTYAPTHDSQHTAAQRLESLAAELHRRAHGRGGVLGRLRRREDAPRSVYLDGGFGVGKTHLLASLWHASPGPKTYATFGELVALVGALGMTAASEALRGTRLVCIDEFELEDPANTRLIAALLHRLVADGACVAATSNTLPGELGQGRFHAEHFKREIETLAAAFDTLTLHGQDYRGRGAPEPPPPWPAERVLATARALGDRASLDDGVALLAHLATLHPIRYRDLVDGLDLVLVTDVRPVRDLSGALRVAYLVDELYDQQIPVALSGAGGAELFAEPLLRGTYRKTLGRCVSRLGALQREAEERAAA